MATKRFTMFLCVFVFSLILNVLSSDINDDSVTSSDTHDDFVTYVAASFEKYDALLQRHERLLQEKTENIRRLEKVIRGNEERISHLENVIREKDEQYEGIPNFKLQNTKDINLTESSLDNTTTRYPSGVDHETSEAPTTKRNGVKRYSIKQKVKRVDSPNNPQIAFHVSLSDGNKVFPVNAIVEYDVEHLDLGGGYYTGLYTAPKSGVYVFTWTTIVNVNSDSYSTRLTVNDTPIGYQWAWTATSSDSSATQVVVTSLTQGDHVRIRAHRQVGTIFSGVEYGTSTFSGWLLQ